MGGLPGRKAARQRSDFSPGQAPILTGPIICGGDNTISGLTITGSADDAVVVNGFGNVTISNNTISNWTNEGVDLDDITGTVSISSNTFETPSNIDEDYINCDSDTSATLSVTNNTFLNAEANDTEDLTEIFFRMNSVGNVVFSGNQADGQAPLVFELSGGGTVDNNQFTNFDSEPIGTTWAAISSSTRTRPARLTSSSWPNWVLSTP